jgi:hypothetical protein
MRRLTHQAFSLVHQAELAYAANMLPAILARKLNTAALRTSNSQCGVKGMEIADR